MSGRAATQYQVVFVTGAGYLSHWCGVSESLYQIVKHMAEPLLVVTSGPNGLTQRLAEQELPVAVLPFPVTLFRGLRSRSLKDKARFLYLYFRYSSQLLRLLVRHRARVVYASDGVSMVLASLAAKLSGAKLVLGIRGEPGTGLHWSLALRLSDRVVVLSRELRRKVLATSPPRFYNSLLSKVVVIYNGVDIESVAMRSQGSDSIRTALGLNQGDILVLYIGAFCPHKAQLEFIKQVLPCFYEYWQSEHRVHFAFVGSAKSDLDKQYEAMCKRATLDLPYKERVHFVGFQQNVWPWYAAADIIVLGSRSEGMPRCVIEAMASGKPVVSYAVSSVKELLQDTGAGIVLPQGDATGMADAVARLSRDEDLRAAMGERGLAFARTNLDIRSIAKSYEKLFAELM